VALAYGTGDGAGFYAHCALTSHYINDAAEPSAFATATAHAIMAPWPAFGSAGAGYEDMLAFSAYCNTASAGGQDILLYMASTGGYVLAGPAGYGPGQYSDGHAMWTAPGSTSYGSFGYQGLGCWDSSVTGSAFYAGQSSGNKATIAAAVCGTLICQVSGPDLPGGNRVSQSCDIDSDVPVTDVTATLPSEPGVFWGTQPA
jgi:hypothetical protein